MKKKIVAERLNVARNKAKINSYAQMDRVTILSLLQLYPAEKKTPSILCICMRRSTAFQVGRLRVRFLMGSLGFIYLSLPASLRPGISRGDTGGRCVGLTIRSFSFIDFLDILGASASWSPQGLSRPVMGLLYLSCAQENSSPKA